jgi:anthraniloyl-CoA monooxygenase
VRLAVIGGGPGGLFFALLLRRARPDAHVEVFERNRPDDTFGWGVVFSDETIDHVLGADPESGDRIRQRFVRWSEIHTCIRGTRTISTGHGFSGIGRATLLRLLQDRCREVGVLLHFEREVEGPEALRGFDRVVVADGVNSRFRERFADELRPEIELGRARFAWLGTTLPLPAFTFIFEERPEGLFTVHAYPYEAGLGTWILECSEETWRRAGLEGATEAETVAFTERTFASHLQGHRILANRSIWRRFPTVRCARWSAGDAVFLGDCVHTAHFSIGSGTKLAMEDAICLAGVVATRPWDEAVRHYEEERRPDVARLQRAAAVSQRWFEHPGRYLGQSPLRFTFNLMTRSKRITYENLRQRDPGLVRAVLVEFTGQDPPPAPALLPFRLRDLQLKNRIVVSPMCQYSAADGIPGDWHLVHLGSRAVGGAGLVMTEMTDVSPEARITEGCTGLWSDRHREAWRRIVDFVHAHTGARIGIQLAHAGRKGSALHPWTGRDQPLPAERAWPTLAPSPLPFAPGWPAPREMDDGDRRRVRDQFVHATRLAAEAGFDLLELHMAHGYLLSSYLSPLSNRRRDAYGGSLENRLRFPLEVLQAVREVWPRGRPLAARISATDWVPEGGLSEDEAVAIACALRDAGLDLIDVSTGGVTHDARPVYGRMYQVPFADRIRQETGMAVMAVGAIGGLDHANTIVLAGRADLVALARAHLFDPYLVLHESGEPGRPSRDWPPQYLAGATPPRKD